MQTDEQYPHFFKLYMGTDIRILKLLEMYEMCLDLIELSHFFYIYFMSLSIISRIAIHFNTDFVLIPCEVMMVI